MRNVQAEFEAIETNEKLLRLFPKTDYSEGVHTTLTIGECTTAYEKAIMAADPLPLH